MMGEAAASVLRSRHRAGALRSSACGQPGCVWCRPRLFIVFANVMQKREFLAGALALGTSAPLFAAPSATPSATPSAAPSAAPVPPATTPLVTVSGAIGRHNRGPVDPALDQLLHKQLVQFDAAYAFDFGMLARMAARTVRPTLEYDAKPHTLRGPLLADVLASTGAPANPATQVLLRALDGYVVATTLGTVREYRFLLATHLDDKPLALGGLGPLWAVYDPAKIPALAGKPLKEQFTLCPWGVYHIQINAVS